MQMILAYPEGHKDKCAYQREARKSKEKETGEAGVMRLHKPRNTSAEKDKGMDSPLNSRTAKD